jgi:hypothetical protein
VFVGSNGIATLVNCELEGNSADIGGGMYVEGTATLYGCTFDDNTAIGNGPDIYNNGGSAVIDVYGNAVGFTSDCTEGDALVNFQIGQTTYSYNGCTTLTR